MWIYWEGERPVCYCNMTLLVGIGLVYVHWHTHTHNSVYYMADTNVADVQFGCCVLAGLSHYHSISMPLYEANWLQFFFLSMPFKLHSPSDNIRFQGKMFRLFGDIFVPFLPYINSNNNNGPRWSIEKFKEVKLRRRSAHGSGRSLLGLSSGFGYHCEVNFDRQIALCLTPRSTMGLLLLCQLYFLLLWLLLLLLRKEAENCRLDRLSLPNVARFEIFILFTTQSIRRYTTLGTNCSKYTQYETANQNNFCLHKKCQTESLCLDLRYAITMCHHLISLGG